MSRRIPRRTSHALRAGLWLSGQWPSTTQPMTARATWIATSLAGKELRMLELTLVGYAR
jgi:hypothetical protein